MFGHNLLASKGECTFQKDYNITGIPRYFLIDKEGKVVAKWEHIGDVQLKELDMLIK